MDVRALEGLASSVEHRLEPLVGGLRVDLRADFAEPPNADALRAAQSVIDGGLSLMQPVAPGQSKMLSE